MKSIINISNLVNNLPQNKRKLFKRIFNISEVTGSLIFPKSMNKWVIEQFGNIDAVRRQKIIKITNSITHEGSLFNELRSKRPIEAKEKNELKNLLKVKNCKFCTPLINTPEDVFGRIKGKYCITASNLTKFDGFHGLVIFKDHDPFKFSLEKISDYIDTSLKWFKKANEVDKKAIYPFFIWNCLWKAGASIVHGHLQLTLSRTAYSKVEHLRKVAEQYKIKYKSYYFDDLFKIHSSLDLGISKKNIKIMVYLTPIKEKEIIIFSPVIDKNFNESICKVLSCYNKKLGVKSFNLGILMPPLIAKKEWKNFPFVVRILDRGSLLDKTSDIGSMELFTSSVIASDPFRISHYLKNFI